MGGHQGGEIASRIAVDTVEEVILALEGDPESTVEEGEQIKPGDFQSYLRYALSSASGRIFRKSNDQKTLKGMGTTTVAVLFRKNMAYIANVGDSRVYRVRDGEIEQVTEDHSLVSEQVKAGLLSPGDAKSHRLKNIITRSVGFQETVEADIDIRAVQAEDVYLLCSDGLSNLVEDSEVRDIVLHNSPDQSCQRLIDLANERGGDDNITVLIARVDELACLPSADEILKT
jgi:protein phosphatase